MFDNVKKILVGEKSPEVFIPKEHNDPVLAELRALRKEVQQLRKVNKDLDQRERRWHKGQ